MRSKRICACCKEPKGKIVGRGLCSACYEAARRRIKKRQTTWPELERRKLALPAGERSALAKALAGSKN